MIRTNDLLLVLVQARGYIYISVIIGQSDSRDTLTRAERGRAEIHFFGAWLCLKPRKKGDDVYSKQLSNCFATTWIHQHHNQIL
jgi:hypothetical protein